MAKQTKLRLDQRMQAEQPHLSRQQIQGWIMRGAVCVDGRPITKPGVAVAADAVLSYNIEEAKYVSRAGQKLERALEYFAIDVQGKVALDAGISTGGFTDCLLQHGIAKVYGVDVGYGQVHEKIRTDERVVIMERTNLRYLKSEQLGELVDLVTLDLSFISLTKVLDGVSRLLADGAQLLVLIKPQFEAQRHEIGRGGIVKDGAVRRVIVNRTVAAIEALGFACHGVIESPISGSSGNREFLAHLTRLCD